MPNRLKIIDSPKKTVREKTQEKFDKLWVQKSEQFDSTKNCMERERLKRTVELIEKTTFLQGKKIVDLGFGKGVLTLKLRDKGGKVTALDVSTKAIAAFSGDAKDITLVLDCMPNTKLADVAYDIVVCTDLIGYLDPRDHRLFFSELARLTTKEGLVVCSTPIDIDSEGALENFEKLVKTEFDPLEWVLSHHSYFIKFSRLLKAPSKFAKAMKNATYRSKSLEKRRYFSYFWFKINSVWPIGYFWHFIKFFTDPLFRLQQQSVFFLLFLEKICRYLQPETGISHALFIGKQRPLAPIVTEESQPIERKKKKTVWE